MERFSNYLSEKDSEELINEVEDFARNRPAVFLGAAFLVGAAAARFLKSSAGQTGDLKEELKQEAQELQKSATPSGGGESRVMQRSKQDRSVGDLLGDLYQGVSNVISLEIELAKTEISQKASRVGKNVGFLVAGGAVAYAGFLALIFAIIAILATFYADLAVGSYSGAVGTRRRRCAGVERHKDPAARISGSATNPGNTQGGQGMDDRPDQLRGRDTPSEGAPRQTFFGAGGSKPKPRRHRR